MIPQHNHSYPHHHAQSVLSPSGPPAGPDIAGYPGYLSMTSGAPSRVEQLPDEENEETGGVRTEGLLRSRKAVLPSEIRRRERSTEDPRRGRGEDEMSPSKALTEIEDPGRRGHRGRARWETVEPSRHAGQSSHQHEARSRPRERENLIYVQRGVSASYIQPKADPGDQEESNRSLHHPMQHPQAIKKNHAEILQDSRVPVAQLRNSYMEGSAPPPTGRTAAL